MNLLHLRLWIHFQLNPCHLSKRNNLTLGKLRAGGAGLSILHMTSAPIGLSPATTAVYYTTSGEENDVFHQAEWTCRTRCTETMRERKCDKESDQAENSYQGLAAHDRIHKSGGICCRKNVDSGARSSWGLINRGVRTLRCR